MVASPEPSIDSASGEDRSTAQDRDLPPHRYVLRGADGAVTLQPPDFLEKWDKSAQPERYGYEALSAIEYADLVSRLEGRSRVGRAQASPPPNSQADHRAVLDRAERSRGDEAGLGKAVFAASALAADKGVRRRLIQAASRIAANSDAGSENREYAAAALYRYAEGSDRSAKLLVAELVYDDVRDGGDLGASIAMLHENGDHWRGQDVVDRTIGEGRSQRPGASGVGRSSSPPVEQDEAARRDHRAPSVARTHVSETPQPGEREESVADTIEGHASTPGASRKRPADASRSPEPADEPAWKKRRLREQPRKGRSR